MPNWKRALSLILLFCLTACDSLPLPRVVFDTPVPRAPSGPTATPLPNAIFNFAVHIPANTPAGTAVAVQIIDDVGGGRITVPLNHIGNNVWTGSTPATVGAVVRYRYIRTAPSPADEVTAQLQPVPYRLYVIPDKDAAVEDTVATWADIPFVGETGALTGVIRNSNTGLGVAGVIVSAGGQLTLTHWDGSYTFFNVPAGSQRVNLLAPDGSLRPAQSIATVLTNQIVAVDLSSPDPNAVTLAFILNPPPGTDPSATPRLIGNVAQLGSVLLPGADGLSVLASRAPALQPMGDGRWAVQVVLYEGTVLNYAYTLGDGAWNRELDASGARRLRQFVVPAVNVIVEDWADAWHSGPSQPVTFDLAAPGTTSPNDVVSLQFRVKDRPWSAPLPMWRTNVNQWRFILYNPTNLDGTVNYRYCRNFACGAADDAATAERNALNRTFTPTLLPQGLRDTVMSWRWNDDPPLVAVNLPPPSPRFGFSAGVDFAEPWQPNALPFYAETVRSLQAINVNTLTVYRRGTGQVTPPYYTDDLALSIPPYDLRALTSQAHIAGLRVTLHPVTCAYTPYGVCEYWNGAAFSPDFWNAWFPAYERYLLTQAETARQSGVDALVVADFKLRPAFPGEPEAPPDADARWRAIIANVRARYSGALLMEMLMGQSVWPNTPPWLDSVDGIRFFWWAALAANGAPVLTDMANAAGGLMDAHILPIQQRFNKPVYLNFAYYSADGGVTQCLRRPDGQCHPFTDFNPDAPDVVSYGLDMAEQADAYNAVLAAVNARPWISGASAYGYNPLAGLRDKSVSVRGKSAEMVLNAWYIRLQGR
jgi:hypothetical protein